MKFSSSMVSTVGGLTGVHGYWDSGWVGKLTGLAVGQFPARGAY
jgi:hypothetical protein